MIDKKKSDSQDTVSDIVMAKEVKCSSADPVWCESTGDFALPDYMPQIARMLSCTPRLVSSGRYIGSDRAEFSGSIVYSVIYTGEDGVPFYTTLTGDYEYSIPLGDAAACARIEVYDEPVIESVSVRASGPRKISARSRIISRPHLVYEEEVKPAPEYDESEGYQRLCESVRRMEERHFESGEFTIDDVFRLEASPDAEPVGCESVACITEVAMSAGAVRCRGEAECRVIYYDIIGGMRRLTSQKKKLRYEREIPVGYLGDVLGVRARPRVISTEMSIDGESGEMSVEILLDIRGQYTTESDTQIVRDIYNCTGECDVRYKSRSLRRGVLCKNMNLSCHGQKELASEYEGSDVVTVSSEARVADIKVQDGTAHISGEITVECVLCRTSADEAEYSSVTIPVPFKCEAPVSNMAKRYSGYAYADVTGLRVRCDKDGISADAEVYLSAFIEGEDEIRSVDEVSLCEQNVQKRDEIVVYYPDKNETLWSVAKKYRVPWGELARDNALPSALPDDAASLEGVRSLVIV